MLIQVITLTPEDASWMEGLLDDATQYLTLSAELKINTIQIQCSEKAGTQHFNEELIRYAALIHNSVITATTTEQCETSCLVNDAFGTTSWFFQDVSDVTFIVFH
jgi:hypothetical protein